MDKQKNGRWTGMIGWPDGWVDKLGGYDWMDILMGDWCGFGLMDPLVKRMRKVFKFVNKQTDNIRHSLDSYQRH